MNLITLTKPESAAAEAYRALRTNIYFAALEAPIKKIVVTSPAPGEDKSTVLANLAVVMAQAEKKVIVVDADLRHPVLHTLFGVVNTKGLSDVLTDSSLLQQLPLISTTVTGLSILTSGTSASNPLDLLNSHRMTDIMEHLAELADIVLFDAAPVTVVSDTAILASQADATLLVVQMGQTRREHAQQAKDLLARAHARLLGAVIVNVAQDQGLARY
jgi:capsular exopolysaccharide synthesis family protein